MRIAFSNQSSGLSTPLDAFRVIIMHFPEVLGLLTHEEKPLLKSFRFKASASGLWSYLTDGSTGKEGSGYTEYYLGSIQEEPPAATLRGSGWSRLVNHGFSFSEGVTQETFEHLCAGRAPDGTVLVDKMRGVHTPGIDLQSSPPKSISIAMAAVDEHTRSRIELAHHIANRAMLKELESQALISRVKCKGETSYFPGEFLVFTSTHHTSRPNAETIKRGSPPDPQLHTHNFIFNVQWSKGHWRAVDHRGIVHAQRAAEAVYQMVLHEQLEELGIDLELVKDRTGRHSFEIAGFAPKQKFRQLIHYCSSRAREVTRQKVEFEKKYGRPPKIQESNDIARHGRKYKEAHGPPQWNDWLKHWCHIKLPIPEIQFESRTRRAYESRRSAVLDRLLGPDGLTATGATFQRWRIREYVFNACVGLLNVEESTVFLEDFFTSDELVFIAAGEKYPDHDIFTTKTCLEQEGSTIEALTAKARDTSHRVPNEQLVARVIRQIEAELSRHSRTEVCLSEEQLSAIKSFISGSGFEILEGEAGTGKSVSLTAVIRILKEAGLIDKAIVVSTAAATADEIGNKVGADISASIESLAFRVANGSLTLTDRSLVLADESVMLDTPRMYQLIRTIGAVTESNRVNVQSPRLRFIGDPMQLQAIGAGGLHLDLSDLVGVNRLTEVRRQRHEWYIEACRAIRAGASERGLSLIEKHGRIRVSETYAESLERVVTAWSRHRLLGLKPEDIIVTTDQSNETIDTLNRLIQQARKGDGELRGKPLKLWCETTEREEDLYEGDLVQFTRGVDCGTDGYIRNGKSGKIERIDHREGLVVVRVGNRSVRVRLNHRDDEQPLRLSYTAHATRSQGREAKTVLVVPGKWYTDRVSAYSMVTRGSETVEIFVSNELQGKNPLATLAELWTRYLPKKTADRNIYLSEMDEAFQPFEPDIDHMTVDELAVSQKTIGWHMSESAKEKFRKQRQSAPEFCRR